MKEIIGCFRYTHKNMCVFSFYIVLTSLNIPFVREIDERMHRKLHKRPNTQSVWHRHSQIFMLWCTNTHKLGIECIPNDVQSDGCAERWATPCNKSIKYLNIIWNDTSGRERPSSSMSTYRAPTDDENGQRCRVENMRKKTDHSNCILYCVCIDFKKMVYFSWVAMRSLCRAHDCKL